MNGREYEQFVRAVLVKRLNLPPNALLSSREAGLTFSGAPELMHQIDLIYREETGVAEYITIIECKYRESSKIDQEQVAKLAYVKSNIKASKAILVTNKGFTKGADSLAASEKIALLKIVPHIKTPLKDDYKSINELFSIFEQRIKESKSSHEVVVCRKLTSRPGEGGTDLVSSLLKDPEIREIAIEALKNPEIRRATKEFLNDNPDIVKRGMDVLKGFKGF